MKRPLLLLIALLMVPMVLGAQNYFDIVPHTTKEAPEVRFAGYASAGVIFMEGGAGPTVDVSLGARIGEHLFVGAETGSHAPFIPYSLRFDIPTLGDFVVNDTVCAHYIPLAAHIKGYLGHPQKFVPYICCSVGGFFGTTDMRGINGFYTRIGVGYDLCRFSMSVGYNCLVKQGAMHGGFVKLGIRFGR